MHLDLPWFYYDSADRKQPPCRIAIGKRVTGNLLSQNLTFVQRGAKAAFWLPRHESAQAAEAPFDFSGTGK
jgi:hypothetical protein